MGLHQHAKRLPEQHTALKTCQSPTPALEACETITYVKLCIWKLTHKYRVRAVAVVFGYPNVPHLPRALAKRVVIIIGHGAALGPSHAGRPWQIAYDFFARTSQCQSGGLSVHGSSDLSLRSTRE